MSLDIEFFYNYLCYRCTSSLSISIACRRLSYEGTASGPPSPIDGHGVVSHCFPFTNHESAMRVSWSTCTHGISGSWGHAGSTSPGTAQLLQPAFASAGHERSLCPTYSPAFTTGQLFFLIGNHLTGDGEERCTRLFSHHHSVAFSAGAT